MTAAASPVYANSSGFNSLTDYTPYGGTPTGSSTSSIVFGTTASTLSTSFYGPVGINIGSTVSLGTNAEFQINGGAAIGYATSTAVPSNGLAIAGEVGIGTPGPVGALDIEMGTSGGNWAYFNNNVGWTPPASGHQGLMLGWNYSNGGGESDIAYRADEAGGSAPRLALGSFNGNVFTEAMSIQNGSVSIGTISPNAGGQLVVNNATGQGAIDITGASDSGATYSALYLGNNQPNLAVNSWVLAHKNDSGGADADAFEIARWANSVPTIPLTILPSGNIGIGSIAPQGTLDVENSSNSAQLCLNGHCANQVPNIYIVALSKLAKYNPLCTNTGEDASGGFLGGCVSACNRYCSNGCHTGEYSSCGGSPNSGLNYTAGIMVEDNGTEGVCACF